jgi:hypothetical protein
MLEEPQDNHPQLWTRVLEEAATRISAHSFDTWFAPLALSALDRDVCRLRAPSEYFRQGFLENYAHILQDILSHSVAPSCRLQLAAPSLQTASARPCLPVVRASDISSVAGSAPWLIERLWSSQAVGFVGGPPKSWKTWTVLEMAVAVASATPCLGVFPVHGSGPVLVFAAEESLFDLRLRLAALAANHGLALEAVDIRVIQADSLRLDRPADRDKLAATVDAHRPALLILDPLVRLHALDENQAGPMAELLGHLRSLQRNSGAAIAIVHHSRKSHARSAGHGLRGSSDLYAFVDSLVALDRRRGRVTLSAEHRSAPPLAPLPLELVPVNESDPTPVLRLACSAEDPAQTPIQEPTAQGRLEDRVVNWLSAANSPQTTDSIRIALKVRKQRILQALHALDEQGIIWRDGNRYRVSDSSIASLDECSEVPIGSPPA